jgi:hypothetical protein
VYRRQLHGRRSKRLSFLRDSLSYYFRTTTLTVLLVLLSLLLSLYAITVNQHQALAKSLSFSIISISENAQSNNNNPVNDKTQTSFHKSYEILVNDSNKLTQSYQNEIAKWQSKQYDNKTMISVTDNYLPKFQQLVNRAKALQPGNSNLKYIQARDLYIKSLQSEIESYKHFRNFLVSGNSLENEKSTEFLSDALKYEVNSFAAFNNATDNNRQNTNSQIF